MMAPWEASAKEYATLEEFKAGNYPMYAICRQKGLIRKLFPSTIPKQTAKQKAIVDAIKAKPDPDASLRDAIDDLIVKMRGIPTKPGKIRKVTVNSVIKDLEKLLKEH